MNDFELLQTLFGEKLIKSEASEYGKPCIKLEETTKDNTYSITIKQVPENTIAIKTDSFPNLQEFFKCSSDIGQCKRADFVVITDTKLIFIELCGDSKQSNYIVKQLKGAQCVMDYCRSIGEKFYAYDAFLSKQKSYFVSISNINVNKKTAKTANNENNDPSQFLKISSPNNLQFNALCRTK